MKLFSFRKNRQLKKLDNSSISAETLAIKKASDKGEYVEFEQLLSKASSDVVIELANKFPQVTFFQQYASQYPTDADAHFLYGNHLIAKAWEARGKAVASEVSADQASSFYSFLNAAQAELHQVTQLNPEYDAVYAPLITVQMGKNDHTTADGIYQYAVKIAPNLLDYHIARLTMLAPKWGGSDEEMLSFARDNAKRDETGVLHGLIVAAHFEIWNSLEGKEAARYLKDKAVIVEVEQAYLEVEHVEFTDDYYSKYQHYLALNYFALLFLLMNKRREARKVFKVIGANYTYRPWANMGKEPGLAYLKFKKLS